MTSHPRKVLSWLIYEDWPSFLLRLQQLMGNISGDFQSLRKGAALSNQTLKGLRSGQITTFSQQLHMEHHAGFVHRFYPDQKG
jgi:hypothetical protein